MAVTKQLICIHYTNRSLHVYIKNLFTYTYITQRSVKEYIFQNIYKKHKCSLWLYSDIMF